MRACNACGVELPEDAHRCEACGAWLTPSTEREVADGAPEAPVGGDTIVPGLEEPALKAPQYTWHSAPHPKAPVAQYSQPVPGYSRPPVMPPQPVVAQPVQQVPVYGWQQPGPTAPLTAQAQGVPVYNAPIQSVQNLPYYTQGWVPTAQAAPVYSTPPVAPPAYSAPHVTMPAYSPAPVAKAEKPKKEGEPELSTGACAVMIVLGLVPLIGLFLCLLWGFGGETPPQKRAVAKGLLWVHAIALLVLLISLSVWVLGLWGNLQ